MTSGGREGGHRSWVGDVVLVVIAVSAGLAAALVTWSLAPGRLDVRTDIVGYPIHSDFNVYRYVWAYGAIALVFPAVATMTALLLDRVGPLRRATAATPERTDEEEPAEDAPVDVVAGGAATRAVVGVVLAVEATALWPERGWVLAAALVLAAAWVAAPFAVRLEPRTVACVHLALAPVAIVALAGVARSARIVEEDGDVRRLAWLPLWAAVAVAAALAGGLVVAWRRRGGSPDGAAGIERAAVIWIFGSLFVFLLQTSVPSTPGVIDTFHEGEFLAGARLTADGRVPWRDLYGVHGLLQDVLIPLAGFHLFEPTRWGVVAGTQVVLLPAYWAVIWSYVAWFVRRSLPLLVVAALAFASGAIPHHHLRFVLTPVAFLLLVAVLRRPSVLAVGSFVGLLALQAVLVPETAYAVLAALSAVVLSDIFGEGAGPLTHRFRRTVRCVAAGLAWTAVIAVVLGAASALGPFVEYVRAVSRGHMLTGGIPIQWDQVGGRDFPLPVILPVVLVLGSFAYVARMAHVRRRVPLAVFALLAHVAFVGLYYTKFLGRADAHVYQVLGMAVPVLVAVTGRILLVAGRWAPVIRTSAGRTVRPVLVLVLLGGVLGFGPDAVDRVRHLPEALEGTGRESSLDRLGYASDDAVDPALLSDLQRLAAGVLGPGDSLYDFTNNPAIFGFLLGGAFDPPTRYYHVSLAIRLDGQEELIEDLEKRRPKLVAYHHRNLGLALWDGIPNQVRHYTLSEYLLRQYRPYGQVGGFLFLVRSDVDVPPLSTLGPFDGAVSEARPQDAVPPCAWGAAPQFLETGPLRPLGEVAPAATQAVKTFRGWAADPRPGRRARMVLAVRGGGVIARASVGGERGDVTADDESRLTGFELVVRGDNLSPDVFGSLRVFAVSDDGTTSELPMGAATGIELAATRPSLPGLSVEDERFRAEPGVVEGHVDSVVDEWITPYTLDAAQKRRTAAIDLGPLRPEAGRLEHDIGSIRSAVTFEPTRAVDQFVVPVAACPQWHWGGGTFYLRTRTGEPPPPLQLLEREGDR